MERRQNFFVSEGSYAQEGEIVSVYQTKGPENLELPPQVLFLSNDETQVNSRNYTRDMILEQNEAARQAAIEASKEQLEREQARNDYHRPPQWMLESNSRFEQLVDGAALTGRDIGRGLWDATFVEWAYTLKNGYGFGLTYEEIYENMQRREFVRPDFGPWYSAGSIANFVGNIPGFIVNTPLRGSAFLGQYESLAESVMENRTQEEAFADLVNTTVVENLNNASWSVPILAGPVAGAAGNRTVVHGLNTLRNQAARGSIREGAEYILNEGIEAGGQRVLQWVQQSPLVTNPGQFAISHVDDISGTLLGASAGSSEVVLNLEEGTAWQAVLRQGGTVFLSEVLLDQVFEQAPGQLGRVKTAVGSRFGPVFRLADPSTISVGDIESSLGIYSTDILLPTDLTGDNVLIVAENPDRAGEFDLFNPINSESGSPDQEFDIAVSVPVLASQGLQYDGVDSSQGEEDDSAVRSSSQEEIEAFLEANPGFGGVLDLGNGQFVPIVLPDSSDTEAPRVLAENANNPDDGDPEFALVGAETLNSQEAQAVESPIITTDVDTQSLERLLPTDETTTINDTPDSQTITAELNTNSIGPNSMLPKVGSSELDTGGVDSRPSSTPSETTGTRGGGNGEPPVNNGLSADSSQGTGSDSVNPPDGSSDTIDWRNRDLPDEVRLQNFEQETRDLVDELRSLLEQGDWTPENIEKLEQLAERSEDLQGQENTDSESVYSYQNKYAEAVHNEQRHKFRNKFTYLTNLLDALRQPETNPRRQRSINGASRYLLEDLDDLVATYLDGYRSKYDVAFNPELQNEPAFINEFLDDSIDKHKITLVRTSREVADVP